VSSPNTTLRILDANHNRAREGLRIMEEFARFVLDDASLTESCKTLRHDLVECLQSLNLAAPLPQAEAAGRPGPTFSTLTACRDIVGDVGREVTAPAEFRRGGAADVVAAAAGRLSEALRAIEEYGKTLAEIGPSLAGRVEELRYRGYDLERRLALTVRARERLSAVRLYVIITESQCSQEWFATAEAVLDGGADCLQLREKDLPDGELLSRAKRLAGLCRERGKLLIVNDRADIAVAAAAHGLHLGQGDLPVSAARRILPPWAIVGKSTHSVEQVEAAAGEVPDYIAVGPMFPTRTKPAGHIPGPPLVGAAVRRTSLPLVAIGGIDEGNAGAILRVAAVCLCVCNAVIGSRDPKQTTARLREVLSASRSENDESRPISSP
jgi:thiamine-phosphate pyrophosphorylase